MKKRISDMSRAELASRFSIVVTLIRPCFYRSQMSCEGRKTVRVGCGATSEKAIADVLRYLSEDLRPLIAVVGDIFPPEILTSPDYSRMPYKNASGLIVPQHSPCAKLIDFNTPEHGALSQAWKRLSAKGHIPHHEMRSEEWGGGAVFQCSQCNLTAQVTSLCGQQWSLRGEMADKDCV